MNLEKITKLLPLGGVILIGLGVLKTSVYYNYFGVDIMSYLTTTEVLTLFLNDLQPLIVLFLVGIIHANSSERLIEIIENKIGEFKFEKFIREKKWSYFIFFLLIINSIFFIIFYQCFQLSNWLIYLLVFSLIQLTVFFYIRKEGEILIENESYMHFFMSISLISIIPLMSLKEIRSIEKNDGRKISILLMNNKTIESSKEIRYLGKASENYFFYEPFKKKTTIIKSDEVKRIEIKL